MHVGYLSSLLNIQWVSLNFQDLKHKPKCLVTFTVGYDQRNNINEVVKKVIWITISYHVYLFWSSKQRYRGWFVYNCSSLKNIKYCSFTMMVGQVNGISLSRQRVRFMLVQENKLNGTMLWHFHVFMPYFFQIFVSVKNFTFIPLPPFAGGMAKDFYILIL